MGWLQIHEHLWGRVEHTPPIRVHFAGELDAASVGVAEDLLRECVGTSCGALALDLSRVVFMDARGVSFLVRAQSLIATHGRRLTLSFPSRAVARVLEAGELAARFEIAPEAARAPVDRRTALLTEVLADAVEHAVALDGAPRGSAQLVDPDTGALRLIAAPGFSKAFRSYFDTVHDHVGTSCGTAAEAGCVVAVPDVCTSPIFLGTPSLDVMVDDAARACISIPVSVGGTLVGMLSSHHEQRRDWDDGARRALEDLARRTALELVPSVAA